MLNTKVNGGIDENNEKVFVTPVSAGLPQIRRLDQKLTINKENINED